ncbi:hypothetical protein Tco_0555376, partial [Tanacetum coccineum]
IQIWGFTEINGFFACFLLVLCGLPPSATTIDRHWKSLRGVTELVGGGGGGDDGWWLCATVDGADNGGGSGCEDDSNGGFGMDQMGKKKDMGNFGLKK